MHPFLRESCTASYRVHAASKTVIMITCDAWRTVFTARLLGGGLYEDVSDGARLHFCLMLDPCPLPSHLPVYSVLQQARPDLGAQGSVAAAGRPEALGLVSTRATLYKPPRFPELPLMPWNHLTSP